MTRASVSELKANLSHYLRQVRRGGEVQIVDRGVPVARLLGLTSTSPEPGSEHRQRLLQSGVLRPGTGNASPILSKPPLGISADVSGALDEDREDRL